MLTYAMRLALLRRAPIALLAEIDYPGGIERYWTGVGTKSFDGKIWRGAGQLGSITPLNYSTELAVQDIKLMLTGLDPASLSRIADDVRNRAARVWLACLDERGNIVRDPLQLADAQLDFQTVTIDESGRATIALTARSGFYSLDGVLDEVWSSQDQKRKYPDDIGLDLLHELQNQDLQWTPT
jgi:hypothetical protein